METNSLPMTRLPHPRRKWLLALLLFVASALILFFSSLQYSFPGKWWGSAKGQGWKGDALLLAKGQGHGGQGKLTISAFAEPGVAVATLSPPAFLAKDYPVVQWSIANSNARPESKVEFLWRTDENATRAYSRQLEWIGDSVAPLRMDGDVNWRGRITGLALVVHGPLAAPITVEEIKIMPLEPFAIVWREWFGKVPWLGTSINFVGGNFPRQWLAPLPFVAAALVLAMLGYALLVWRRVLVPDIRMLWALLFIAWFALDMRWQIDLWEKLGLTQQRYAGKSWEEKHLAAEDGQLFDLMQHMKAKLPATAARVFLFADDEYMRGRGAYHLYPFNVMNGRDLLSSGQFRSGDFIIILGKNEVGFDPPKNLLTWEPQQQLAADLLLLAADNVLLKVR